MSGPASIRGNSAARPAALAHLRYLEAREHLRGLDLRGRFEHIYRTNLWGAAGSRSGLGSQLAETERLRAGIPELLAGTGARSLLDVPCGDFGWLSRVALPVREYIGADIVAEVAAHNQERYGSASRRFLALDLTRDPLPAAEAVLCRDCLVHLSFANIFRALANIKRSGCAWLLTTTFPGLEENEDIEDGDWRPLNLERPPFGWPAPAETLVEGCTEAGGAYADKSLGLWRVAELTG